MWFGADLGVQRLAWNMLTVSGEVCIQGTQRGTRLQEIFNVTVILSIAVSGWSGEIGDVIHRAVRVFTGVGVLNVREQVQQFW